MMMSAFTKPIPELDIYSASSLRVHKSLHSDKLFWFPTNQSLLLLFSAGCFRGEATNTNFKVFGLIGLVLKSTIYRTWVEDANHYITDAVSRHFDWFF